VWLLLLLFMRSWCYATSIGLGLSITLPNIMIILYQAVSRYAMCACAAAVELCNHAGAASPLHPAAHLCSQRLCQQQGVIGVAAVFTREGNLRQGEMQATATWCQRHTLLEQGATAVRGIVEATRVRCKKLQRYTLPCTSVFAFQPSN
jgi:hypothetical protein